MIFPQRNQVSPVNSIVLLHLSGLGGPDILLFGNRLGNEPETGPLDASCGVLLMNKGKDGFRFLPNREHSLWACGETRRAGLLKLADGAMAILVANNNGPVQLFYR